METKGIGVIDVDLKAVKTDNPNGEFEAILSTPTVDRDGEIVDAKAFDPLPEHITIDVDHGMSVDSTVASGKPFYDGQILKVRGSFSSILRAQEVRTLVDEGHITKMSIAFMDAKREVDEKDGKPHVRKGELLNAAIVAIPSNRDANILAAKAALKVGARNSASDASRLQQAHDLFVELGASCEAKSAAVDDTKNEDDAADKAAASSSTEPEPAADKAADSDPLLALARATIAQAEVALLP